MILFVAIHGMLDAVERAVVVVEEDIAAAAEAWVEVAESLIDGCLEIHVDGYKGKGGIDVLHGVREVAFSEDDTIFMLHLLHDKLFRGVLIGIYKGLRRVTLLHFLRCFLRLKSFEGIAQIAGPVRKRRIDELGKLPLEDADLGDVAGDVPFPDLLNRKFEALNAHIVRIEVPPPPREYLSFKHKL